MGKYFCFFSIDAKFPKHAYRHSDILLPFAELLAGRQWVFQQDNDQIHRTRILKHRFNSQQIKVLYCTSCSPDFNRIQNLWDIMTRKVYENNQILYSSRDELKVSTENNLVRIRARNYANSHFLKGN